jgi:hypothetical protein
LDEKWLFEKRLLKRLAENGFAEKDFVKNGGNKKSHRSWWLIIL